MRFGVFTRMEGRNGTSVFEIAGPEQTEGRIFEGFPARLATIWGTTREQTVLIKLGYTPYLFVSTGHLGHPSLNTVYPQPTSP